MEKKLVRKKKVKYSIKLCRRVGTYMYMRNDRKRVLITICCNRNRWTVGTSCSPCNRCCNRVHRSCRCRSSCCDRIRSCTIPGSCSCCCTSMRTGTCCNPGRIHCSSCYRNRCSGTWRNRCCSRCRSRTSSRCTWTGSCRTTTTGSCCNRRCSCCTGSCCNRCCIRRCNRRCIRCCIRSDNCCNRPRRIVQWQLVSDRICQIVFRPLWFLFWLLRI
ncbi:unnamed protein product [Aphis gossypii]|uniref:Uncharacterized protein n=1 Tax=Aphis gossypii TaxID=80765 RepID=A0A9P0JGV3_APHGO|nr:unnamed protein product [Aphis gossypii]